MEEKDKNENPKEELNEFQGDELSDGITTEPIEEVKIEDEVIELNKKLKEALEKVQVLEEEKNQLNEQYLRKSAEFENYKRRTENDISNIFKYRGEDIIAKIIPVFNDLERSLSHLKEEEENNPVVKGIKLVKSNFEKVLKDEKVEKIKSVGEEFNFELHEALLQQSSDEFAENIVIQEVEPGYIYKDKVIKHSKVIVSIGSTKNESSNENTENNTDPTKDFTENKD